jgi:peptide deformylase
VLLKIVKFPHPVLRKKARALKRVTPEIVKLIDAMTATMRAAPGVGLAAPQVGKSVRVIVTEVGPTLIVLVNPKIAAKSGQQVFTEGCLCFPGVEAPVERASQVLVKGLDREGKAVEIAAEGLLATVLQHEVDHLEGVLFVDRVKDPSLIRHVSPKSEKKEELF